MNKRIICTAVASSMVLAFSNQILSAQAAYTQEGVTAGPYHPFTISGDIGTTGIGGSVSWRFMDNLAIRGGFDYLHYSKSRDIQNVTYDATIRLKSQPVTLDLYPWTESSFHISLGAFFNQNKLDGTGVPDAGSTFDLNGNTYTAAQVGTLNLHIAQQPIDPYLSIGGNFFYFDKGHHVSLGGELGVAYGGSWKVGLTRSGGTANAQLDSDLAAEQANIKHKADQFKFWPVAKLELNVSF